MAEIQGIFRGFVMNYGDYLDGRRAEKMLRRAWVPFVLHFNADSCHFNADSCHLTLIRAMFTLYQAQMLKAELLRVFREFHQNWQTSLSMQRAEKVKHLAAACNGLSVVLTGGRGWVGVGCC